MRIIGHNKIQNILNKSIEKGNIGQAYLFCGPESLGKFKLALELAEKITGNEKGKINPDIIIVRPEVLEKNGSVKKEDIKIEKIRELKKQMSVSAYGKHKIAIIDDADRMNRSAQNALLKILEEPPQNSVLILVSKANNNLLPTILSRCQIVKFGLVSNEEIEKNIPDNFENKGEIVFWSLGRPGLAMNFLENAAELERRKEIFLEFQKLFSQNFSEKSIFAEAESKNVASLLEKMNLWIIILREWVLKNKEKPVISRGKSFLLIDLIGDGIKTISETNANPRLVLENLLLEF